jgi:hypothetical protein
MNLEKACIHILSQLKELVTDIDQNDFSKPSETLNQSTLGQHLRHTLEFFICFEQGFTTGTINYDKRGHDKLIETDKFIALATINRITSFIECCNNNIPLKLEVGYDLQHDRFITIDTNATRELVYNIEHAVHHMAIMKIGIREIAPYINLPYDFGIAASTVRYRESTSHASHQG